jgi:hypothetical protein
MIKLLSKNKWLYDIASKIVQYRIENSDNFLTEEYLISKGWIKEGEYYTEPNIKERDRISITFGPWYYRIYHGKDKTFIALKSRLEYFEHYYNLLSK